MNEDCDLLVIGAGPAGTEAAIAAARAGLAVVLADEAPAAGGQVFRTAPENFAGMANSPEKREGGRLRQRLAASAVETRFGHIVWSVSPGFRADALGPEGLVSWRARAVLVATGAQERVVPFPGWTLPGVTGLAGTSILLKAQAMLPGRSTIVAGQGPLLLAVADGLLKAGGDVVAVVDLASPADWLAAWPSLLARPDLLVRGLGWLARLHLVGVPILHRHAVRRAVRAIDGGLAVTVGPVDAKGQPVEGKVDTFVADALAVGNGLSVSSDVTRLLRAQHAYDALRGGWIPVTDGEFRTSVPGLYAVGDGAGLVGAAAAAAEGRLAGLAVARDLGRTGSAPGLSALRRAAARARRFGAAMAKLMALRPGLVSAIPMETIVCRCEDVTRREIEAAMVEGARTVNQIKAWTRCGMGPCQGRICGDIVGALAAGQSQNREAAGYFTGRTPFRPLPLDEFAGTVDYADLSLPPPAPL